MLGFFDIPESWENWEISGEENLRHTVGYNKLLHMVGGFNSLLGTEFDQKD
jgi:hypothetical protein